jgi:recombination protein RecA
MGKMDNNAKLEALKETLKKIEKEYGTGTVMRLDEAPSLDIDVIPSGSIALDYALGIGGYPRGRIIEIYGPESSGKTTLAMHAIAEANKKGELCAMIDAENAFDRTYAEALGINMSMLYVSQPNNGEEALEIAEQLISSGSMAVVVIDSVAALVPKAELEGEMGDSRIGLQARLMSQALRKMAGIVNRTNTCVIFINQLREKIGVMFGNPETTTGGNALKFYASVRLDVRRRGQVKSGDEATGNETTVKVVKNKVAPPFRKAEFVIEYGKGICRGTEVLDMAVNFDIIHKAGSWFSYNSEKLGQGRDAVTRVLDENPDLYEEIEQLVRQKVSGISGDVDDITVHADEF